MFNSVVSLCNSQNGGLIFLQRYDKYLIILTTVDTNTKTMIII